MEYKKCLVQLDEMLDFLSKEDLNKIPNDIRKKIKSQKDTEYKWKYDSSISLKEQNLSRETIAMLAYLNMQYLVSEEQKLLLQQMHNYNEQKLEEEKSKNFNQNDIFKERKDSNVKRNKK